MIRNRILPIVLVMIGAAWLGPSQAQAAFEFGVKFTVDGTSVFVNDNSVQDSNGLTGQIAWSGVINGVNFAITLTTSDSPGGPGLAKLELQGLQLANTTGSAKSITIAAAANDYTTGVSGGPLGLSLDAVGQVTQAAGPTTVTYTAYADLGNDATGGVPTDLTFPFGTATSVSSSVTINTGGATQGFHLANFLPDAFDPSSAYALGGQFEINLAGGANLNAVSGKSEAVVPEPATGLLALLSLPLVGLGGWIGKRYRRG